MQSSIQIIISGAGAAVSELLIAKLSEVGFDGFEEEPGKLVAYCSEDVFDEPAVKELLQAQGLSFEKTVIAPQNWNEVWERNFSPVVVDDFVAVRASFHQPIAGVVHEIVITPKMSFGTGHHATTWMMMQQMRKLDFAGKDVFDFGTGTGILAILAKKLGAVNVTAIDIDEWSITNAQENFDNNDVAGIMLGQAATPEVIQGEFDVILANINKNVLMEYMPVLAGKLKTGGKLLLSGLLAEDEQDILLKASQNSLLYNTTSARDKWICILMHA
jgi:ribosomal protein L11 methyltransferase